MHLSILYYILHNRIHESADIHNIWTNIYTSDYEQVT